MPKETPVVEDTQVVAPKPRKPRAKKPTTPPAKEGNVVKAVKAPVKAKVTPKAIASVKAIADTEPTVAFIDDLLPKAIPTPTPQNRLKTIPLSKAQRELASPIKEVNKEVDREVKRTLSPIVAKVTAKVTDKAVDKVAHNRPLVIGSLAYLMHVLGSGLTVAALVVVGMLIVSPKAEAALFEINSSESVTSLSYSTNNAEMEVTVTEADNVRTTVTNQCIRESTSKLTCSREVTYEKI
jgi:hypothetical protein